MECSTWNIRPRNGALVGSPNYFGRWRENWDFLISTFTANIAPGFPLYGIQAITRTEVPAVELMPAIGIQFKKASWEIIGMQQRRVTQHFAITVAYQQDQADGVADTGSAAIAGLLPYVNDGTGKGIEPLLNDLGPQAGQWVRSLITDLEMDVLGGETVGATAIAYARFMFEIVDQVKGGG
jgi:hypothetical protein